MQLDMMKKGKFIFVCLIVCILFSMAVVSAHEDVNQTLDIESDSLHIGSDSLHIKDSLIESNHDRLGTDNLGDMNNTILSEGNDSSSQINYWYVNASQSSGNGSSPYSAFKTLNEALHVANDGDVILIAPGLYTGSGQNVNLKIDKNLTLFLYGKGEAKFDAKNGPWDGPWRIWNITSTSIKIIGLSFVNGKPKYIEPYTDSEGRPRAHEFDNRGGALLFENELKDSIIYGSFENNAGDEYGGAIYFKKSLYNVAISGSFINNTVRSLREGMGGAIYFEGDFVNSAIGGIFMNNHLDLKYKDGYTRGGVHYFNGKVINSTINGSYINNYILSNYALVEGCGGVNFFNDDVVNVIINGTYIGNLAYDGAVNYFNGEYTPNGYRGGIVQNLTIDGNYTHNHGYGYYNEYEELKRENNKAVMFNQALKQFWDENKAKVIFAGVAAVVGLVLTIACPIIAPSITAAEAWYFHEFAAINTYALVVKFAILVDAATVVAGGVGLGLAWYEFAQKMDDSFWSNSTNFIGHGGVNYFAGPVSDLKMFGTYRNNTAKEGGANFFAGSISNSDIDGVYTNNKAQWDAGANYFQGKVTNSKIDGTYTNNQGGSGGTNFFADSITDSDILGIYDANVARTVNHDGGAANYFKSSISNSTIRGEYRNNKADWSGGANFFAGSISNSDITGVYTNNSAKHSGGANFFAGSISNSDITGVYTNNNAKEAGGANYFREIVTNSKIGGKYTSNRAPTGANAFYKGVINTIIRMEYCTTYYCRIVDDY